MISIPDGTAMVEGTVGSKKVGTHFIEEESKDKKSVRINNSVFFLPVQSSLLDPAIVVMDLDQTHSGYTKC